jgi:hypothetical protein
MQKKAKLLLYPTHRWNIVFRIHVLEELIKKYAGAFNSRAKFTLILTEE